MWRVVLTRKETPMNVSPQTNATTQDNIRLAIAALTTARKALFFGAKSAKDARKDPRVRAVEAAICEAIDAVGARAPALDVRAINRRLKAAERYAEAHPCSSS
jgi:hypothetical protein